MKETKYIIRKIIIGVGIALCLMFIKSCNVNAAVNNPSFFIDGYSLTTNIFRTVPEGSHAFKVNYDGYPNGLDNPSNQLNLIDCIFGGKK